MRLVASSLRAHMSLRALSVWLVLLLSACQGSNYLQHGIGTQLPPPDIENSTTLQTRYFKLLCQQVGFDVCDLRPHDRDLWTLVALQGMNDIDRRCDAYLAWLDDRKRSRGPLLRQVNDTRAATTAILSVVDPRGAAALQIVAVAFDLITNSIENYHSRLLLEVESSTINSIVLQGRYDYRTYIRDKQVVFRNRPEAEHALRSYLRLCLPFAIEAKINNFSTLGANGEKPGADNTLGDLPVVGPTDPANAGQGTGPLPPTNPDYTKFFGVPNFTEARLKIFQRATCTEQANAIGPKTRAAITIVEHTLDVTGKAPNINLFLDVSEYRDVDESPCGGNFTNYFEKVMLAGGKPKEIEYFESFVVPAYRKVFNMPPTIQGEAELANYREIIAELRGQLTFDDKLPSDFNLDVSTWLTPRLHVAIEAKALE